MNIRYKYKINIFKLNSKLFKNFILKNKKCHPRFYNYDTCISSENAIFTQFYEQVDGEYDPNLYIKVQNILIFLYINSNLFLYL